MTNDDIPAATPYPGLRPFRAEETDIYFGRDEQRTELLGRLRRSRFLAVVGTSGSGKSSLVRAGLLPGLHGGFMAGKGTRWRVVDTRPGSDPIGRLALALDAEHVLRDEPLDDDELSFTETTLRRSSLGLVDVVREARLPEMDKVLILVDQFEELFRFADADQASMTDDDASAFVKLLLAAARHTDIPIYVVLTMRSDFLGDCARFRDLPEAINDGQYLVPRLTRDQLKEAVIGPAAVFDASLEPTLVNRILNDVGDDPDQLPILQHALMRSWDKAKAAHPDVDVITLEDYRATGGMAQALSLHADSILAELEGKKQQFIAEKLFKCLTERNAANQEIRRLAELQEIADVADVDVDEVIPVVDAFRERNSSFLMPPIDDPLTPETYVDISHESLIRNWVQLQDWVDEETNSAREYKRLAQKAVDQRDGRDDLLSRRPLGLARKWFEKQQPTSAWARRYHPSFDIAMNYLEKSQQMIETATNERSRKRRTAAAFAAIAFLGVLVTGLTWFQDFLSDLRIQQEEAKWTIEERNWQLAEMANDRREMSTLAAIDDSTGSFACSLGGVYAQQAFLLKDTHQKIADRVYGSGEIEKADCLLIAFYQQLRASNLDGAKQALDELNALAEPEGKEGGHQERTVDGLLEAVETLDVLVLIASHEHVKLAQDQWNSWGKIEAFEAKNRKILSDFLHEEEKLSEIVDGSTLERMLYYGDPLFTQIFPHLNEEFFELGVDEKIQILKSERRKDIEDEISSFVKLYGNIDLSRNRLEDHDDELRSLDDQRVTSLQHVLHEKAFDLISKIRHESGIEKGAKSIDDAHALEIWDHIAIKDFEEAERLLNENEFSRTHDESRNIPNDDEENSIDNKDKFLLLADKLITIARDSAPPRSAALNVLDRLAKDVSPAFIKDFWDEWGDRVVYSLLLVVVWSGWHWARLTEKINIKIKPNPIRRMLAAVTDLIIAALLALSLGYVLYMVLWTAYGDWADYDDTAVMILFAFGALIFFAYFLGRDTIKFRYRRSIGKILFGLRPVCTTDKPLTWRTSAKRHAILAFAMATPVVLTTLSEFTGIRLDDTIIAFAVAPLAPLLIVEFVLASIKERRTIGDRLAKTQIVDVLSEQSSGYDWHGALRSSAVHDAAANAALIAESELEGHGLPASA